MREAFTYMFKDPGFTKKSIIYILICFLSLALTATPDIFGLSSKPLSGNTEITPVTDPIFLILPLIGLLFNCILQGYFLTCTKALTEQTKNFVIPMIRYLASFLKGIKFSIGVLLISFTFALLSVLAAYCGKFGLYIFYILLILIVTLGMGFIWVFANEGKILTFFAWRKVAKLVYKNKKTYFKNLLLLILLNIIGILISTVFMFITNLLIKNTYLAWIITSLENAIIVSYIAFASMFIIAKAITAESDV